jgi:hypothetical protein
MEQVKKWGIEGHTANLMAFLAVVVLIGYLASNRVTAVDQTIMVGLIGVLGSFKPWSASSDLTKKVEVDQPANNPIPTQDTGLNNAVQPTPSDEELPAHARA